METAIWVIVWPSCYARYGTGSHKLRRTSSVQKWGVPRIGCFLEPPRTRIIWYMSVYFGAPHVGKSPHKHGPVKLCLCRLLLALDIFANKD